MSVKISGDRWTIEGGGTLGEPGEVSSIFLHETSEIVLTELFEALREFDTECASRIVRCSGVVYQTLTEDEKDAFRRRIAHYRDTIKALQGQLEKALDETKQYKALARNEAGKTEVIEIQNHAPATSMFPVSPSATRKWDDDEVE